MQCNSAANLFYSWPLCFFFSLSLSREEEEEEVGGKEVEEAEGEEGSQMSIYRNVSAGGDRCEVIVIIIII